MSENTSLKKCQSHNVFINLITVLPQSLDHVQMKCKLLCPLCYVHYINKHNICTHSKQPFQKPINIYLNKQSQQYYKEWTEGILDILKHTTKNQSMQSTHRSFTKIFQFPNNLINILPNNIYMLWNTALAVQIKLLTSNLKYVSYFQFHHLANSIFINDLYNIILGKPQYSVTILLQNFKILINQSYMTQKININIQYLNQIKFNNKFVKTLKQFQQNMLRKYGKYVIMDYQFLSKCQIKQKNQYRQTVSLSAKQCPQSIHKLQWSQVVQKSMIQIDKCQQKNMQKRKTKQQHEKRQYTQKKSPVLEYEQLSTPQTHHKTQQYNMNKQDNNRQKTHRNRKNSIQQKQKQTQTPRKHKTILRNSQELSRSISPTPKTYHHLANQTALEKIKELHKNNLKISLTKTSEPNQSAKEQKIANTKKTTFQQQKTERISAPVNSQYLGNLINQMSLQQNNLKFIKHGIEHQVKNIDKTIQSIYQIQTPTKQSNENISKCNNCTTIKNKYFILQKQFMDTLHQIQAYKHQLITKTKLCEQLQKEINNINQISCRSRQLLSLTNEKQDSSQNAQQSIVPPNPPNSPTKSQRQQIQSYIKYQQCQQIKQKLTNLSLFNLQLIQQINHLQFSLNKNKQLLTQQQSSYLIQINQINRINQQYYTIINNQNNVIQEFKKNQQHKFCNFQNNLNKQYQLAKFVQLENVKKSMKKNQEQLKKQINKLHQNYQSLLKQKLQLQLTSQKYLSQIQSKTTSLAKVTTQLTQLYAQNKQIILQYNRLLQHSKQKQAQQTKIQQLISQLHENQQTINQLRQRQKLMKLQYPSIKISRQFTQYKQYSQQSQDQSIYNQSCQQIIDNLKKQLKSKFYQIQQYNYKLQQLQLSLKQTQQQLDKFNQINSTLSKCIQELANKYQQCQMLQKNQCLQNQQLQVKIQQLLEQLTEVNQSNKNMRMEMERIYQQIIHKMNKEIMKLKKQKDNDNDNDNDHDHDTSQWSKQKQQLQNKQEVEVVNSQNMKNQLNNLKQQLQQKATELEQITKLLTEKQTQNKKFLQQNEIKQKLILTLKTKLEQNQHQFNNKLLLQLIQTQSKLKTKQFYIQDILKIYQLLLNELPSNKKHQYQLIINNWNNKYNTNIL